MEDNGKSTNFGSTLQQAAKDLQDASGADILALYPYDEETDSFFAPIALGLPEGDVLRALPDLADQLRRFRADQAEGKTPEDLSPGHYGPSAWLLTVRKPLVTADATHEVESSFVRRHHIQAMVGLPLLVGRRSVGLLYLNYVREGGAEATSPERLKRIEDAATLVAERIDTARRAEEAAILRTVTGMVAGLSILPDEEGQIEQALQRVLAAIRLNAAALYLHEPTGARLVAAVGCPTLAAHRLTVSLTAGESIAANRGILAALEEDDLHLVATQDPSSGANRMVLLLADRDEVTLARRPPIFHVALQTSADLLNGLLEEGNLRDALDESSRTLSAVTRLGTRLLQPAATQEHVLRTAVAALTDPTLPELDFEFAAFYLLDGTPDGSLQVTLSAGATTSDRIDSHPDGSAEHEGAAAGRRVPAWITSEARTLSARDIVSYVATRRRAVVVGPRGGPDTQFLTGYPEDRLERLEVPIIGADGSPIDRVYAARLREEADRAPLQSESSVEATYNVTEEFTLDATLYQQYGHDSLVRVFMPFGPIHTNAGGKRATGILEAGYHVTRKHRFERVQIEALRACAATLAASVETARLYEDVSLRAKQLEIVTEVSRTIATSIDLEQTLGLVARNMARAVDASLCLIALLEEDGSAWYGAAASDMEDVWRQRRVERPEHNIVFEVADRAQPIVVEHAQDNDLVSGYMARLLNIRSLVALPLLAGEGGAIGAVILGQRDKTRIFTPEEVDRASGLAGQAAMAIRNARVHAREEEEQHIQKDVVLVGFGQWGQKAYKHLVLLKHFFNFRTHIVEQDRPGRREQLAQAEQEALANGDVFYWDSAEAPARDALGLELEPSCYVITYIATPAETHLPLLKSYYDISNVVLIEKPLGAPPEEYRAFLDRTDGTVQIVAADHYWFKIEVRLLALLLTEERNLRAFLDEIEEVEIEILEEQVPSGSGAQIGMIADLIPHAFAVLSLLTPLDRLELAEHQPLRIGLYQPQSSEHETYARLAGSFDHRGRRVRVSIDVGKGVTNAKWIKLSGGPRMGGRRSFYKFDFSRGEAIDGTQSALRAATRPIRQPGVPDNAHLSMLRHVVEKKHPAVGILSIREALRANARIQALERLAADLMQAGQWTPYEQGQRPVFADEELVQLGPEGKVEAKATAVVEA